MIEELKHLGLGNYEAKAVSVLINKKLNLRELSKEAKIPFGKVYSVIKSLKEKNFIKETNSRPKLVYIENFSEVASALINTQEEKEKQIKSTLRTIATQIDKENKGNTKFFDIGTTITDNKRIQIRTFKEANEEVLQLINIHHKPASNRDSKTLWEKEIVNATRRGVVFKAIYPKDTILPKILSELHKKYEKNFQVRRIDSDFTRFDVIDKKKALIKLVSQDPLQFGGVFFIEDEKLAENLTRIFYNIWDNAGN